MVLTSVIPEELFKFSEILDYSFHERPNRSIAQRGLSGTQLKTKKSRLYYLGARAVGSWGEVEGGGDFQNLDLD